MKVFREALTMPGPQTFCGIGTVYTSRGTTLEQRRYSITLLPYTLPPLRGIGDSTPPRPACMGCFVELFGREPLELEGEPLTLRMHDGRSVRFVLFDVSSSPPFRHTMIVEAWPEVDTAEAVNDSGLRHSA